MKKTLITVVSLVLALSSVAVVAAKALPQAERVPNPIEEVKQLSAPEAIISSDQPTHRTVIAEAVVVPQHHVSLSVAASGIVSTLLVQEGDQVVAGQPILGVQDAHQRAAVAQAEAALSRAKAGLAAMEAGPREPEIAASLSALDAAEARYQRLLEGSRPEDIAAAEDSLAAAEAALQNLYDGPETYTRIASDAELANAEAALSQAQAAYDKVAGSEMIAMLPQSLQLQQATNQYNAAKAGHDALNAAPRADTVAGATAQVSQAMANLARLRQPARASDIAEAEAMVGAAQAQLDLLLAGPRQAEIDAAIAAVAEAEAALQQVLARLADTILLSPMTGTVASLSAKLGEPVVAGQPIVQIADLDTWEIQTTDLTELDVVGVQAGDRVLLTFDAIDELELGGTVIRIRPVGKEILGDVTYVTVVRPDVQDPRLRWNMTALVTIP